MSRVAGIPAILFVLALPLFLVTASVSWAVNDPGVYQRGFAKYDISLYTGISNADLRQAGTDIRHYFNSSDEPLALRSRVFGAEQSVFNQREVQHMLDVKRLIRGVYAVAVASGIYLLATIAAGFAWRRRRFVGTLAWLSLWGGGLTLALVFAIGVFALTGFEALFLKFHQLSFSNDLWRLDPSTDYLVIMFPEGFWFDAAMSVATLTLVSAVLLTAVSGGYLTYCRWRLRVRQRASCGSPA